MQRHTPTYPELIQTRGFFKFHSPRSLLLNPPLVSFPLSFHCHHDHINENYYQQRNESRLFEREGERRL